MGTYTINNYGNITYIDIYGFKMLEEIKKYDFTKEKPTIEEICKLSLLGSVCLESLRFLDSNV